MVKALDTHYARALADAVMGPHSDLTPEQALLELRLATDVLQASPDLQKCLLSPAVPRAKKEQLVATLATEFNMHRLMINTLRMVVHHRRIGQLRGVATEFERIIDERTGFQRADIVSATALNDEQKSEIVSALGQASGKTIRPHFKTDPSLLGGVVARLASKEYDGSLKGRLEVLRRRLRMA
jgi:F-type H+-transporting ATPase subunit delta